MAHRRQPRTLGLSSAADHDRGQRGASAAISHHTSPGLMLTPTGRASTGGASSPSHAARTTAGGGSGEDFQPGIGGGAVDGPHGSASVGQRGGGTRDSVSCPLPSLSCAPTPLMEGILSGGCSSPLRAPSRGGTPTQTFIGPEPSGEDRRPRIRLPQMVQQQQREGLSLPLASGMPGEQLPGVPACHNLSGMASGGHEAAGGGTGGNNNSGDSPWPWPQTGTGALSPPCSPSGRLLSLSMKISGR